MRAALLLVFNSSSGLRYMYCTDPTLYESLWELLEDEPFRHRRNSKETTPTKGGRTPKIIHRWELLDGETMARGVLRSSRPRFSKPGH